MEPLNWNAIILGAGAATAVRLVWNGTLFGTGRQQPGSTRMIPWWLILIVMLIASAMLGHSFARIGKATLDFKPWLYFMQTGGIALAFVIPALALTASRQGLKRHDVIIECSFWLAAYLAIGATFWVLG